MEGAKTVTTILHHDISFFYRDSNITSLPESEEEHIQKQIIEGYNQGQLVYCDENDVTHYGWWKIESGIDDDKTTSIPKPAGKVFDFKTSTCTYCETQNYRRTSEVIGGFACEECPGVLIPKAATKEPEGKFIASIKASTCLCPVCNSEMSYIGIKGDPTAVDENKRQTHSNYCYECKTVAFEYYTDENKEAVMDVYGIITGDERFRIELKDTNGRVEYYGYNDFSLVDFFKLVEDCPSGVTFELWQYPPGKDDDAFEDGDLLHSFTK